MTIENFHFPSPMFLFSQMQSSDFHFNINIFPSGSSRPILILLIGSVACVVHDYTILNLQLKRCNETLLDAQERFNGRTNLKRSDKFVELFHINSNCILSISSGIQQTGLMCSSESHDRSYLLLCSRSASHGDT